MRARISWTAVLLVAACGTIPPHANPPGSSERVPERVAARIARPASVDADLPPPACPEVTVDVGPWARASGFVAARRASPGRLGDLEQDLLGSGAVSLRFLGAHLFDL